MRGSWPRDAWRVCAATAVLCGVGCSNDFGSIVDPGVTGSSVSSAAVGGGGAVSSSASGASGGSGVDWTGGAGGSGGAGGTGGSGGVAVANGGAGGLEPIEGVACGGATCVGEQICCVTAQNPFAGGCSTVAACRGVQALCDGPEDCDGQVCCGEARFDEYTHIECAPGCGGFDHYEICKEGGSCLGNKQCLPSDALGDPWHYCQ